MSLSTTSALGDPGSHAFAVDEGRDMTRAFRLAARHSRRVRKLRVAIPATIVFILTATILVSWLDPLKVLGKPPNEFRKDLNSGHQDHHGGAQAQRLHARSALV